MLSGETLPQSLARASRTLGVEVRAHFTRHRLERDPLRRAERLAHALKLDPGSILFYVNLSRRKLAIVGAPAPLAEKLADDLKRNLRETHPHRALQATLMLIQKEET